MSIRNLFSAALMLATVAAYSAPAPESAAETEIRGKIKIVDAETGEELTGVAIMVIEDPGLWAMSGLDGSFILKTESGQAKTLKCSILGYKDTEIVYDGGSGPLLISLDKDSIFLGLDKDSIFLEGAVVSAENHGRTEASARGLEKAAMNVVNILSSRAIELSPDMTVANVIQRMSGVTVERNSSGEGRYAILRGMDKRYNYTLVNGVKIPSPDNKNRFVPLDIFPSEMLDRLEVTKSLTADMEVYGIGGAVNLVMKYAP